MLALIGPVLALVVTAIAFKRIREQRWRNEQARQEKEARIRRQLQEEDARNRQRIKEEHRVRMRELEAYHSRPEEEDEVHTQCQHLKEHHGFKIPLLYHRLDELTHREQLGSTSAGLGAMGMFMFLVPPSAGIFGFVGLCATTLLGMTVGANGAGHHAQSDFGAMALGLAEGAGMACKVASLMKSAGGGSDGKGGQDGGSGGSRDEGGSNQDIRPPEPGHKDENGFWDPPPRPGGEYKEPFPGGPSMPPPRWERASMTTRSAKECGAFKSMDFGAVCNLCGKQLDYPGQTHKCRKHI